MERGPIIGTSSYGFSSRKPPARVTSAAALREALSAVRPGATLELDSSFVMEDPEPIRIDVPGLRLVGVGSGERRPRFVGTPDCTMVVAARGVELHGLHFEGGRAGVYSEQPGLKIDGCSFVNVRTAISVFAPGLTRISDTTITGGSVGLSVTGSSLVASGVTLVDVENGICFRGSALFIESVGARCTGVALKVRDVSPGSCLIRSTFQGWRAIEVEDGENEQSSITLRSVRAVATRQQGSTALHIAGAGHTEVTVEASRLEGSRLATGGTALGLAGDGVIEVLLNGTCLEGGPRGLLAVDCAQARVAYDGFCLLDDGLTYTDGTLL